VRRRRLGSVSPALRTLPKRRRAALAAALQIHIPYGVAVCETSNAEGGWRKQAFRSHLFAGEEVVKVLAYWVVNLQLSAMEEVARWFSMFRAGSTSGSFVARIIRICAAQVHGAGRGAENSHSGGARRGDGSDFDLGNGRGIEVQHQERIFRVFERLCVTDVYTGNSIGLAMVRNAWAGTRGWNRRRVNAAGSGWDCRRL